MSIPRWAKWTAGGVVLGTVAAVLLGGDEKPKEGFGMKGMPVPPKPKPKPQPPKPEPGLPPGYGGVDEPWEPEGGGGALPPGYGE